MGKEYEHEDYEQILKDAVSSLGPGEMLLIEKVGEGLNRGVTELVEFLEKLFPSAEGVDKGKQIQAQSKVVTTCMIAALTIGGLQQQFQTISAAAGGIISRLVNWFLNQLLGLLTKYGQNIAVDSWGVAVSGGFPWGINVTITVTFK